MTKRYFKNAVIVLVTIIVLCLLTMAGLVIAQTVVSMKNSEWDLYGAVLAPFIILIMFLLAPFYVAIGYEGMDISIFSPANMFFWFWLAIFSIICCMIALCILYIKQAKQKKF